MAGVGQAFSIDDAFELGPEDKESVCSQFGRLSFERKGTLGQCDSREHSERESSLRYQNLENEDVLEGTRTPIGSAFKLGSDLGPVSTETSRWSFSNISNSTQHSYRHCLSWTRHPLILKNRKVVIACFLLLGVGLVLVVIGIGLEVHPSSGLSSPIVFIPGFLLLIPGVYHVIFIYCAVKGKSDYRFFYLPYFEK